MSTAATFRPPGGDRPGWKRAVVALLPALALHGVLLGLGGSETGGAGRPGFAAGSPSAVMTVSVKPVGLARASSAGAGSSTGPAAESVTGTPLPATAAAARSDGPTGEGADDLYLPRSALDVPPHAAQPVDLPYPDDAPPGRFRGVLTLFIDQDGRVRRVVSEAGSALPPRLENEARQAFMAARFDPGRKDGRTVRSRLRVEVSYDSDEPRPTSPP